MPASVVMASAVGRLKPVRARGAADDYWNRWLAAVALRPDIERLAKRSIKAEARPSAKTGYEKGRLKRVPHRPLNLGSPPKFAQRAITLVTAAFFERPC